MTNCIKKLCVCLELHSISFSNFVTSTQTPVHIHNSYWYMFLLTNLQGIHPVWVRADAITGYVCNFNIQVGKSDGDLPEVGLGERVVLQLCRPLQGGNYQIFCDNFFSTVSLFVELLQQKIYACGMTQMDRCGFPETLKSVVMEERGQTELCQRGKQQCGGTRKL